MLFRSPQAPAGSAPPPGGSRPPIAPGPARRVPWATVSRETGLRPRHRHPVRSPPVRASAGSQCPPLTPHPAQRRALSARGDPGPGVRGLGRRARSGAHPTPLRRPRQRAALALCFSGVDWFIVSFSRFIASLLCLRGAGNPGCPAAALGGNEQGPPPGSGRGRAPVQGKMFTCQGPSSCRARLPLPLPPIRDGASCAPSVPSDASQSFALEPRGLEGSRPGS